MKNFIRVMKALSDPNRVKVMKMLEEKELCVCEITSVLGLAPSTVSKHLKILEDAELVDSCKKGAWVNYTLAEQPANQYATVLRNSLKKWLEDDSQIKRVKAQAKKADRTSLCQTNQTGRI